MKKIGILLAFVLLLTMLSGCEKSQTYPQIAATTLPIYEFTSRLCEGTGITVGRLVTENVSCLHDYTLQVSQMRAVEAAELVIVSGAGLEDFLTDALADAHAVLDASSGIPLLCGEQDHGHGEEVDPLEQSHHHEQDPHIWLDPENAKIMAQNICSGLSSQFPSKASAFQANLAELLADLDTLARYGREALQALSSRELITFHDGFAYFAQAFGLSILKSVEEESGSEAPASELIALVELVKANNVPAIFTEQNGSTSAANIIASESGIPVFTLDMAMAGDSYFEAMYHNIDTIKEALG